MKKMYYDSFADEYVSCKQAEEDTISPPERYLLTLRGDDGVYVETYKHAYGTCLDIAYSETDIKLGQVNRIRFNQAERHGWKSQFQTATMIQWTIPSERFDKYYAEYIGEEGAEE